MDWKLKRILTTIPTPSPLSFQVIINESLKNTPLNSGHWNFVITTVSMRPRDIQIRDIHGSRYSNRVVTFVDLASKRIYIFINRTYLYTIAIHPFAASREMVTLQNFIHSNSKVRTTLHSIINTTTGKNYPVAFEWLHHRIPSTDSKVRPTLYSIVNSNTGKYCSVAFI